MMQPARLTEIRRALQLSQEAMARLLGVSFATVNRWEGGHSAPTGLKAGDVLGTTPMESGRQLQRIFNLAYGGR